MGRRKKGVPSLNALNKTAEELIKMAEDGGVEQNYFFVTTFARYKKQIEIVERLQKIIDSEDLIVEKEYVKGRANPTAHPALGEFNKTCTAANQTASTLLNIIKTFAEGPILDRTVQEDDYEL